MGGIGTAHVESLPRRLEVMNLLFAIGRGKEVAGTDCGFSTFAGLGAVDPEIAWAKAESFVEGAASARQSA